MFPILTSFVWQAVPAKFILKTARPSSDQRGLPALSAESGTRFRFRPPVMSPARGDGLHATGVNRWNCARAAGEAPEGRHRSPESVAPWRGLKRARRSHPPVVTGGKETTTPSGLKGTNIGPLCPVHTHSLPDHLSLLPKCSVTAESGLTGMN